MKILGDFEFQITRRAGFKELMEDIIVAILCHLIWYAPTIAMSAYLLLTAPDAGFRAAACLIIIALYTANHIVLSYLYANKWYTEE